MEDKFSILKNEFRAEEKNQKTNFDELCNKFDQKYQTADNTLKTLLHKLEEEVIISTGSFNQEANKLLSKIESENEQIEKNQVAVENLLQDVLTKIEAEIMNEKKERDASEETTLIMLENTCNKIQKLND